MRQEPPFCLKTQQILILPALLALTLAACDGAPASVDVGALGDSGPTPDGGPMPDGVAGAEAGSPDGASPDMAPAKKPAASAGEPRFATAGKGVYLDGSGSTAPTGCKVAWAAGSAAPGPVTFTGGTTLAPLASAAKAGTYPVTVTVTCPGETVSDNTALYVFFPFSLKKLQPYR